ncbi:Dipeptidyl-peptidase 5 [Paramyrothecium foliicola]|nr:Dipeptidyl-peptidase 5 [Paramyrothecium foliicola]
MTIQSRFTPEVLLSAPRRSSGVPNFKGDLILYTVTTYSFQTNIKSSQIRVLNVHDHTSRLVTDDGSASEPFWLSDDEIAYVKSGDHDYSHLLAQNVRESPSKAHTIHSGGGLISNPKVTRLSPTKLAFCCSIPTGPNGEPYWQPLEIKPRTSAKIYTSLFVRHWDTWSSDKQNSLWYGVISKPGDEHSKWTLEEPRLINLLANTRLSSPVPPFGGVGDFDISSSGIAFVAKDPDLNPARYTKTDLYYVPISSFTEKPPTPQIVKTGTLKGYSLTPTFSHDGRQIAFARMRSQQYEADKPRLLLVPDVSDLNNVQEFFESDDGEGSWDLRPDSITWAHDNKTLYVTAEKNGRNVLWKIPATPREATSLPTAVYEKGSVSEVQLLGDNSRLLLTSRSRIENSLYTVLDLRTNEATDVSSTSKNGKSFGLSESQLSDIWYEGAAGYDVHALVMTPSNFDPSKKYPLAFLIHGGPQSAWTDDWSTRWNPAIFAEQGYVVVAPNPTGSTGYGQAHIDAIQGNWGGAPYEDLVKCFEYIEKELEYVDTDRAVALGASYGGYMINWIQGHDLGRRFKCLVCHDGVFSTLNQWSTEELFFPEHDFEGTLWDNRPAYEKWDPAKHTGNWATPMLVIHNELDYRLPISEGLAMFNVLQAREIPSKFVMFPDENHWVLKPGNSLVWHREVLTWINKYSGVADEGSPEMETLVGKMKVQDM